MKWGTATIAILAALAGVFLLTVWVGAQAASPPQTVWVTNCLTPSKVQFTGTPAAAATWIATAPQAGSCWFTDYGNPSSTSTTTTTSSSTTTTTTPNPCLRKGYEASHERKCGPL